MTTFQHAADVAPYHVTDIRPSSHACEYCSDGYDIDAEHAHASYAQREGASTRTADELVAVFLYDVESVTTWRMSADVRVIADACDGWIDDADDADALRDAMYPAESALSDAGLSVDWDDGYVISEVLESADIESEVK